MSDLNNHSPIPLISILGLGLLFAIAASCDSSSPGDSKTKKIEWVQMEDADVRKICLHHSSDGCHKEIGGVCTMITRKIPLSEFTGYNHDMHSSVWRALAHETAHCFGYDHQLGG